MNMLTLDPGIWHEAAERVENHLLAYRVENRALLERLRGEILGRAAARQAEEPERAPVELAAEETERHLRGWVDRLIGPTGETPRRRFARGRAAIFLAGAPGAGAEPWTEPGEPLPEWVEEVRAARLEAAPGLEPASMVPRSLDLGLVSSLARGAWQLFTRWPALRGVTIGLLSVSLIGTAFFLVHP